ncbi:MAG TPA: tetratricopeptide repeat protein, partial [Bacteroidota bacterium]|nr:tetratricopeptide repeat protein [Bacteroidota bacterium]
TDKARGKIATNIYVAKTILKRKQTKRMMGIAAGVVVVLVAGWYFILGPKPPANSLAVLPFTYIGDQANSYIADGVTEDVLSSVSQLAGVKVLSEGSTQSLRNTSLSEKEIAKKLNVRFLLRGSVELGATGDITVHVRLAEPAEDVDLLSPSFTKSRNEIPSIEHEIFRNIALKFQEDIAVASDTKRTSQEVYDLYWQGLAEERKEKKESNQLAITFFRQAVSRDTSFARGYIKLASVELLNQERGYDPSDKWLQGADSAIHRAYRLDSTNAELYWVLGRLYLSKGDHQKGITYLQTAIKKEPNLMRAHLALGDEYLFSMNDPQKAIAEYTIANELEPTNYGTLLNLGNGYAMMKNYPDAISSFQRASMQNTTQEGPLQSLGYLYMLTGMPDSAEVAFKEAERRNPANPDVARLYAMLLIEKNRIDEAETILKTGLQHDSTNYALLDLYGTAKNRNGDHSSAVAVWKSALTLSAGRAAVNPNVSLHFLYCGIFNARLGQADSAVYYGGLAWKKDPSSDNAIGAALIYSILDKKSDLIEWFAKAKSMDPEYDASYLAIQLDFDKYKSDSDLLAAANSK